MKYLRQFLLILFISFLGELLKYFLPLPIPASIYGMVILFIGLLSGIIQLDAVKDVGKFLIEIMPVMFIPAGVGLMASWGTLKPVLVPVSVITVVALVAVMGATGRVSQCVIKKSKAKEKLQLIQKLESPCTEETELLNAAIATGAPKIIIKRPAKGPWLAGKKPSYTVEGKVIRYDVIKK